MPLYEYHCEAGHRFEAVQGITDAPLATCQDCAAPVQRVVFPSAVIFKGKGWTPKHGR